MRQYSRFPRSKQLRTETGEVRSARKKRKNQKNHRRPEVGASVRRSRKRRAQPRLGRPTGAKLRFQESALDRHKRPDGRRRLKKIVWRLPRKRPRNWRASAMGSRRLPIRPFSRTGAKRLKQFFRPLRNR